MSVRCLLPLLVLIALLFAPFGRISAAEAMAMPHDRPTAAAMPAPGHCHDMPAPDEGAGDKAAIDCTIACAVMAPPGAATFEAVVAPAPAPIRGPLPVFAGLHPEADPPPPRRS